MDVSACICSNAHTGNINMHRSVCMHEDIHRTLTCYITFPQADMQGGGILLTCSCYVLTFTHIMVEPEPWSTDRVHGHEGKHL